MPSAQEKQFVTRTQDVEKIANEVAKAAKLLRKNAKILVEQHEGALTDQHVAALADVRSKLADLARAVGVDANAAVKA